MPPKIKITREEIVSKAVDIVRQNGADTLNARMIASELDCSTQPIFSNFATMKELRTAVIEAADLLYKEYTEKEIKSEKYPLYKATGMAYIRFAREEKNLFKLLFMRDRSAEVIPTETQEIREIADIVKETTGLSEQRAELFHLEMWAYVHGIATMLATDYLQLDTELVSRMLTDAYQGLKIRYETKEQ